MKIAVKTPNESVVESIGSVLNLHSAPNRNSKQVSYHNEMVIDWNGPPTAKADQLIIIRFIFSRKFMVNRMGHARLYY